MKTIIITTLFMFFSFLTFSQKYPRIEKDSLGNKFVIMTYEQAQKIDNTFELVNLLEKPSANLAKGCGGSCESYKVRIIIKFSSVSDENIALIAAALNVLSLLMVRSQKLLICSSILELSKLI